MANEQNLIPLNKRSKSVQREIQDKGRKANKEKWAEKKLFKDLLNDLLGEETVEKESGKTLTKKQLIALKTVKFLVDEEKELEARDYIKVMEFVRDTIGEKPVEKQEITVNDDSAREMDEYFARHSKRTD